MSKFSALKSAYALALLASLSTLGACALTPAQQAEGQLFCRIASTGAVVALETAAGVPVIATGETAAFVAAACAALDAVPVAPPAVPVTAAKLPAGK